MGRNVYIGIDPGAGGGLAFIAYYRGSHKVLETTPMPPTEKDICEWLDNNSYNNRTEDTTGTYAIIEKVHSMPKQGVASTFKFGMNYGFLRGCLIALGISFQEVTPRQWMKALGIRTRKKTETPTQWKNYLKGLAQQEFPEEKVTLKTADALLIAKYCMQCRKED